MFHLNSVLKHSQKTHRVLNSFTFKHVNNNNKRKIWIQIYCGHVGCIHLIIGKNDILKENIFLNLNQAQTQHNNSNPKQVHRHIICDKVKGIITSNRRNILRQGKHIVKNYNLIDAARVVFYKVYNAHRFPLHGRHFFKQIIVEFQLI